MNHGRMARRAGAALALFAALAAHADVTVILVRHAELDATPGIEARQVALSEAGQARARKLAAMLEGAGVAGVYATDFARTQQTAAPVARAAGREVTVVSKGDAADFVARLHREHEGETVLVVGHTDTLPGIVKALGCAKDVRIDSQDYGNVFVVSAHAGGDPTLLRLRY